MKSVFTLLSLLLFILYGCNKPIVEPAHYSIRIELKNDTVSPLVLVTEKGVNRFAVDTIHYKEGFYQIEGSSDSLVRVFSPRYGFELYVQNHNQIKVTLDSAYYLSIKITHDTINSSLITFDSINHSLIHYISDSLLIKQSEKQSNDTLHRLKVNSVTNILKDSVKAFGLKNNHGLPYAILLYKMEHLMGDTLFVQDQLKTINSMVNLNLLIDKQKAQKRSTDAIYFVGNKIPYCSFETDDNKRFNFNETLHSYAVITFWATWDTTSLNRVKELEAISKRLNNRRIEFINISLDTQDSIWKSQVKTHKLHGKNFRLKGGFADEIAERLFVDRLPYNIITDTLVKVVETELSGKELSEYLNTHVPENKKKKELKTTRTKP